MLKYSLFKNCIIFSNGQTYYLQSLVPFFTAHQSHLKLKTDYFSNRLWDTLDEPQLFINLVRFERRYNNKQIIF